MNMPKGRQARKRPQPHIDSHPLASARIRSLEFGLYRMVGARGGYRTTSPRIPGQQSRTADPTTFPSRLSFLPFLSVPLFSVQVFKLFLRDAFWVVTPTTECNVPICFRDIFQHLDIIISDPAWQAPFSILDPRFSILDSRFSILDSRFSSLDSGVSIFDSRSSIFDSRLSILNHRSLISRFSLLILDSRSTILRVAAMHRSHG